MTKKLLPRNLSLDYYAKKLTLIMKLTTLLLILTTLQISAIGLGQDAALKLDSKPDQKERLNNKLKELKEKRK